jgi:hypothetical protein
MFMQGRTFFIWLMQGSTFLYILWQDLNCVYVSAQAIRLYIVRELIDFDNFNFVSKDYQERKSFPAFKIMFQKMLALLRWCLNKRKRKQKRHNGDII